MSNGMPSFLADAVERIAGLGAKANLQAFLPSASILAETEETTTRSIRLDPSGPAVLQDFPRKRATRSAELVTMASFVDYLARPHDYLAESGVPVVTVDRAVVVAAYNPDGHEGTHRVVMPLEFAESFKALQRLIDGVKQKTLWTLLATDLQGCFPEEYEYVISQLSHYSKHATEVDIQRTGITTGQTSSSFELTWKTPTGDKSSEIEIDWTYVGPLWSCYPVSIEIPLRLVITPEDGLLFRFFPRGLEALLLQHRAALANQLTADLAAAGAAIPVYEGKLE